MQVTSCKKHGYYPLVNKKQTNKQKENYKRIVKITERSNGIPVLLPSHSQKEGNSFCSSTCLSNSDKLEQQQGNTCTCFLCLYTPTRIHAHTYINSKGLQHVSQILSSGQIKHSCRSEFFLNLICHNK